MLYRTKVVLSLILATLFLAACGGTPRTHTPDPIPATRIARIDIQPSAVLLTRAGETHPFTAQAFDEDGKRLEADFTWHTSKAEHVIVDHAGVITSISSVGSAQVHAKVEGVRSAPSQVVVAELHEDTILVDDLQVISGPTADAPDAAFYQVTLRNTPAPTPGVLMLARESAAIAGRVVSSVGTSDQLTVVLELVPLGELFVQHDLAFEFDLSLYDLESTDDVVSTSTFTRQPDGSTLWRYEPHERVRSLASFDKKKDFPLGPLECSAAGSVYVKPTVFDISLASTPVLHYVDSKSSGQDRYVKLQLVGDMVLTVSGGVKVEAGLTGEVSCELVKRKVIPIGGFVSLFIAPAVPMGVGFGIDGKFILADGEAVVTGNVGASMDLGFECGPEGRSCRSIDVLAPIMELKPEWKIPGGVNDMRIEVGAGFHLLTGLDTQFFRQNSRDFNKSVFRLTAGPRGDLDLRTVTGQTDDRSYASHYDLKLRLEATVGSDLQEVIDKLLEGAQASFDLEAHVDKPLFRSPFGSLTVDKSQVDTNKSLRFTVHLDPSSVLNPLFGYMVNEVQIYRVHEGRPELLHSIPVSASNQTRFDYDWTATKPYVGQNEFVAFVVSKWLPFIPLEVNDDSTVQVEVVERCGLDGQALARSNVSDDAVATQADPCICEAYQDVLGWNGRANFSYSFTFDDGMLRLIENLSGALNATLNHEFDEDTYAATAWASPTGNASLDSRFYGYTEQDLMLISRTTGNKPVNPYTPPTGSRVFVNFDLWECRYNVYGRAEITATVASDGGDPYEEVAEVAAFGTDWMPLPTGGVQTLSGGGAYPVYSESAIFFLELDTWLHSYNTDMLEAMAGEGNLGTANVTWSFTPDLPPTAP